MATGRLIICSGGRGSTAARLRPGADPGSPRRRAYVPGLASARRPNRTPNSKHQDCPCPDGGNPPAFSAGNVGSATALPAQPGLARLNGPRRGAAPPRLRARTGQEGRQAACRAEGVDSRCPRPLHGQIGSGAEIGRCRCLAQTSSLEHGMACCRTALALSLLACLLAWPVARGPWPTAAHPIVPSPPCLSGRGQAGQAAASESSCPPTTGTILLLGPRSALPSPSPPPPQKQKKKRDRK